MRKIAMITLALALIFAVAGPMLTVDAEGTTNNTGTNGVNTRGTGGMNNDLGTFDRGTGTMDRGFGTTDGGMGMRGTTTNTGVNRGYGGTNMNDTNRTGAYATDNGTDWGWLGLLGLVGLAGLMGRNENKNNQTTR
jgi:hypothetical protein